MSESITRVLIVKLSSLGDVIHTLPAVTEAAKHCPGVTFDWLCEPAFSDIPKLHPAINQVFEAPLRKWRRQPVRSIFAGEMRQLKKQLRQIRYDIVIDAQGLIKSSVLARWAKAPVQGPDANSAREGMASLGYARKYTWDKSNHATMRIKQLFGKILGYTPTDALDYGLKQTITTTYQNTSPFVFFFHGTTWESKHWPLQYWQQLADLANTHQLPVKLLWGNATEYERAQAIARTHPNIEIIAHHLPFIEIMQLLAQASAVVSVDTGLSHLAAAMHTPTISLYGPTDPKLAGTRGPNQIHLQSNLACAPCLMRHCNLPIAQKEKLYPSDVKIPPQSSTPRDLFGRSREYFSARVLLAISGSRFQLAGRRRERKHTSWSELGINPPCFASHPPEKVWIQLQSLLTSVKEESI